MIFIFIFCACVAVFTGLLGLLLRGPMGIKACTDSQPDRQADKDG